MFEGEGRYEWKPKKFSSDIWKGVIDGEMMYKHVAGWGLRINAEYLLATWADVSASLKAVQKPHELSFKITSFPGCCKYMVINRLGNVTGYGQSILKVTEPEAVEDLFRTITPVIGEFIKEGFFGSNYFPKFNYLFSTSIAHTSQKWMVDAMKKLGGKQISKEYNPNSGNEVILISLPNLDWVK